MGRFSLFVGYYGVQGRGGANDAKGWNSIDEGRWKEGGRREDKRAKGQEAVVSGELKKKIQTMSSGRQMGDRGGWTWK